MPKPYHKQLASAALLLAATLPSLSTEADEVQAPRTAKTASQPGHIATPIGVTLDFARVLVFDHPARTVIIGNPAIVDGTMSDEHTIVLTGKAVGVTNMIVLGDGGQEVANLSISVFANGHQVTTVYHGVEQKIFSCSETCRPMPTVVGK